MPYQDFRQFLDVLRQQGELIDVDRPIALTDVGKALKQAYQKGRPAVSFNNNGTEFPLVCGVYSDRNKALLAFQSDEKIDPAKGARRSRQSDRADDGQRRRALPRGRHHRRRHRHQPLSDPDLQPEGRRALHHARHRGVEGSGNRRAGHRPLSLSHSRQGHLLVLGAAVPPLRQEPGEVPEDGRDAEGRADHRRRSDPGLHLPGAGPRPDQRLGGRRRPARRADRARQMQDLRHRSAGDRRGGDRVRGRHGQDRDGRPARRIHRLLHAGVAEAGRRASPPSRTARSRSSRACSPASRSPRTTSSSRFRSRRRSSRR